MNKLNQSILENLYWKCIKYRGTYIAYKNGAYEQLKFIPYVNIPGATGHLRYMKSK